MDNLSPPTAAELGVSEVEYERILRDVRRRDPAAPPPVAAPQRARRPRWRRPAILGLVATVAVLVRLGGHDAKPEYAFLDTVAGGKPVTYSSCRPVRVAVYPAGGPAAAAQLVREAVTELRDDTGLDIVLTGAFGGYAPN